MSPTEHDLRNALRDDGGDRGGDGGVDVNAIIAAGEARRAQRRTRIASGVGVAALVAVVAVAVPLLSGTGGDEGGAGSREAGGGAAATQSQPTAGKPNAPAPPQQSRSSGALGRSGSLTCPTSFPRQLAPGGGGTGQFGAKGKLFAKPVATITVCGFASAGGRSGQVVLNGALAQQLVTSLENASTTRPGCPTTSRPSTTRNYALLATATDGSTQRAVTATLTSTNCPNMVTNGTAIRYGWQPPAGVSGILDRLGASTPGGRVTGSPVRS